VLVKRTWGLHWGGALHTSQDTSQGLSQDFADHFKSTVLLQLKVPLIFLSPYDKAQRRRTLPSIFCRTQIPKATSARKKSSFSMKPVMSMPLEGTG
jgi:hypothetical protein